MKFIEFVELIKEKNKGKICIIRMGCFFVTIGIESCLLSDELGLLKICYSYNLCKVGVPYQYITKYIDILEEKNISFCVFDYTEGLVYDYCFKEKKYIKVYEHLEINIDLSKYTVNCERCIDGGLNILEGKYGG